jgi:hypothetical protein
LEQIIKARRTESLKSRKNYIKLGGGKLKFSQLKLQKTTIIAANIILKTKKTYQVRTHLQKGLASENRYYIVVKTFKIDITSTLCHTYLVAGNCSV